MTIKSEAHIYKAIETRLREVGDNPQTCVDLFDVPDIRKHVENTNRLSDHLGHMWRRGLLQRWYAPKDSAQRSRYAYTWLEQAEPEPTPIEPLRVIRNETVKLNVTITEDEHKVVLDFKEFTITIQSKQN